MLVVVGVSHPALALRAQGSRIRAGGTLLGEALSLLASKSGEEKNPAKTTCRGISSFSPLQSREGRPAKQSHVEHGHACRRFCCWIPGSRHSHFQFQPRGGRRETSATSSSVQGRGVQEPQWL